MKRWNQVAWPVFWAAAAAIAVFLSLAPGARAGQGRGTLYGGVTSLGGSPPAYRLSVNSTSGVTVGDHLMAAISGGGSGVWEVSAITSTTITVEDSLTEEHGGAFGAPVGGGSSGVFAYSTPTMTGLTLIPDGALYWTAALRRNVYLTSTDAAAQTPWAANVSGAGFSLSGVLNLTTTGSTQLGSGVSSVTTFSGPIGVSASVGTAGQVLTSGGPGAAMTWTTVATGGNETLAQTLALGADGNGVDQTNLGSLTQASGKVILSGDGAVGAPAYAFASDTDTGVFRGGANDLRLVAGGTSRITVTAFDVTITPDVGCGNLNASTSLGSTGSLTVHGNSTLGDAAGDTLTVSGTTSLGGQVSWPTGLGAINQVLGPSDQTLSIRPGAGRTTVLCDNSGSGVLSINAGAVCSLNGNVMLGNKRKIVATTGDINPTDTSRYNNLFTNSGASGAVNITAETAAAGIEFILTVEAAQYLKFTAATGDVISGFLSGTGGTITTSATAGYVRSNVVGSTITLVAIDATTWRIVAITGTWTIDS